MSYHNLRLSDHTLSHHPVPDWLANTLRTQKNLISLFGVICPPIFLLCTRTKSCLAWQGSCLQHCCRYRNHSAFRYWFSAILFNVLIFCMHIWKKGMACKGFSVLFKSQLAAAYGWLQLPPPNLLNQYHFAPKWGCINFIGWIHSAPTLASNTDIVWPALRA